MGMLDFMNFVLNFPPAIAIVIVSGLVSLVTSLAYKFTTDQKLMKQIKDDIKKLQGEMRSEKDPVKAAQLQKDVMKHSMRQFSASTKSTLITLIPLFLLFGWMGAHLAYEPIKPGEEFTATVNFKTEATLLQNATLEVSDGLTVLGKEVQKSTTTWRLKGEKEGDYKLIYGFGDETYGQAVVITNKFEYAEPALTSSNGIKKESAIEKITVGLKPIRPLGDISILGWEPGWLGTYIIISLAFSMLLRKLLTPP